MIFEVEVFKVFVLVTMRFVGLMVAAPVLGSRNFPAIGKLGFAALCAMLITPVLPLQPQRVPEAFLPFALWGANEVLVGLALGFVMTLAFAAIQVAGQIMDMLTGFALVNVFNPAMETQVPIFGFFYFLLAALYLLVLDGHLVMVEHLAATFDKIPLGGMYANPELIYQVEAWGTALFVDGLLIAAPLAAVLLLAYVTMGLMGRVVPQIHLFVVGFPLTVGMGLLVSAFMIQVYLGVVDGMFSRMWERVGELIVGLS